jgi:hypothetical protein
VQHLAQSPLPLRVFSVVFLGELILTFLLGHLFRHVALGLFALAFGAAIAWYVPRGSRVAWSLVLFSVILTLVVHPFLGGSPWWGYITGVVYAISLCLPVSLRFVWVPGSAPPKFAPGSASIGRHRAHFRFIDSAYALAERLRGLRTALADEAAARSPGFGNLVVLLVVWVVVFFPLVGTLDNLRHGSARGNEAVDVLWHVSWIAWNLVLFALIALLVIARSRAREK